MTTFWVPDLLGDGFEQLTLPLGHDDEGSVVATLVRSIPNRLSRVTGPLADVDVLYVHGWSDFFFQTELAHFWTRLGARFYALDLRKYGRSLREGHTPGYIESLETYDEDIAAAREVMARDAGTRRLVLMGHSTGGLTLTLWAARHPDAASAIVLNSPWLELQLGAVGRQALAPLVGVRAKFDPRGTHPAVDLGYYTRAQNELGSLPPSVDMSVWRPPRGFATHPGWLNAVIQGHRTVAAGVEVGAPALVLLSKRFTSPFTWSEALTTSDSVLVVDDIARAATRIGSLVTIARIDGAIHDVFLSAAEPRRQAYDALEQWIIGCLDPRHPLLFGATDPRP
ncbi:alpha/beta hydrolase [Microbacterium rhizomatis]|uniref:Alpha/beta hydrolase n=1 Tax=Microbacterium rhizomatis TaxID=1631477 RepID=A0A5J5J5W8_9MICO|nr:alpha/beta hydrolase [Microbacterium rhizomatis]KAA9111460.1 alpha/beta hydrolase [Microbacterium rhizomatis]